MLPNTPEAIAGMTGLDVYPHSVVAEAGAVFFMARPGRTQKQVGVIVAAPESAIFARFAGTRSDRSDASLLLCPLTHANAAALRATLPWLQPRLLGLRTSAGCGDRLGLATPGHVRAARAIAQGRSVPGAGSASGSAMIFAQQSIREMTRTGRTPDDVMDDATWGIFQEGWREGVGADADHLKTPADIDRCLAAGFTFFTIDPGDHVDPTADTAGEAVLRARFDALPWFAPVAGQGVGLATTTADLRAAYVGKRIDLEDRSLMLDEETLVRAAVKYGRAVAHVAMMYRHLNAARQGGAKSDGSFELEVSVDETTTPTSHAEHVFIVRELRRLGVRWVSLAPRYVGRFEKGVDYIGDLAEFERDFAGHAAIARALGPYKLSLHSGSDKFSIYGIATRHSRGLIHLKTAGTSYLEALRVSAGFDPSFFREITAFSIGRYEIDRASYHVSADLAKVPDPVRLTDAELPSLLDQFDARQVLHIAYGSVLTSERGYRARLLGILRAHEEEHYAALERHFVRHLQPLAG